MRTEPGDDDHRGASGVRAAPVALQLGLAMELVATVAPAFLPAYDYHRVTGYIAQSWALGAAGFAAVILLALGVGDLARRHQGGARTALVVAAGAFAAYAAWFACWQLSSLSSHLNRHEAVLLVYRGIAGVTKTVALVGVAIAAWSGAPTTPARRVMIVASAVIGVTIAALPVTGLPFSIEPRTLVKVWSAIGAIWIVALAALAWAAAGGGAADDPVRAALGLRRVAGALWLRLVAGIGLAALIILLSLGSGGGSGAVEVLKLAMVGASLVSCAAFLMLGMAALVVARTGGELVPAGAFGLAGALALWCAGVNVVQLPMMVRVFYLGDSIFDGMDALSVAQPTVAIAACALVGWAIGGYARRVRDRELVGAAVARTLGFVALTGGGLALQTWGPQHQDAGTDAFLMLIAAVAAMAGQIVLARLCVRGAEALEAPPPVPLATATVVSAGRS